MIELTDSEKLALKAAFSGFTDRDIIRELVRRGRLRQVEAHASYWSEMRDDSRYMDHVRSRVLACVANKLADDKENVRPTLLSDEPHADIKQRTLSANLVYLVARCAGEG